jgi:hypothetical protein
MTTSKKVTPVLWKRNSPNVDTLSVYIVNDDLSSTATFAWVVSFTVSGSTKTIPVDHGNVLMQGADYATWKGDNLTPFQYVASKLSLTLTT